MNVTTIQKDYIKAGSPDTSSLDLEGLSHSSSVAIRRRVGENERTPTDVLELLSRDPEPEVRIAVGLSRRTPDDVIAKLLTDSNDDVRYWLASASFLPKKLLEQLAGDPNPYVEDRARRTLERLGSSSGVLLNVFELLSEDHGWILKKLGTLTQNYSNWSQQMLSDKTAEVLDDIRKHLERRHTLCSHWFDQQSGLPDDITKKCLVDQETIIDQTSWLLEHGVAEPDSLNHLNNLHKQIRSHKEFIENELFVEIKKHTPAKEIDAINERLNQTTALPNLGYKDVRLQAAVPSNKVVVRSLPGEGFEQEIQVGAHSWKSDATREEGGGGASPDPHSYLFGALGSCTSMTLLMYAQRHGWDLQKVVITISQEKIKAPGKGDHLHQVRLIRDIAVEGALSDEQLARLKVVADKCPIHKLLIGSKEIATNLALLKSPVSTT